MLLEAAEKSNDENMLLLIRGKDCVAIEVRYHRSCHLTYTRCLTGNKTKPFEMDKTVFDGEIFKRFCEFVDEKILKQGEIIRMVKLRNIFNTMLAEMNPGVDGIETYYLKRKLKLTYPQLEFSRPSLRNLSEIVFVSSNITSLADNWDSQSQSQESELEETQHRGSDNRAKKKLYDHESTRNLYMTAVHLKGLISDYKGCSSVWPPTADDLSMHAAKEGIPSALYNLLAWITGSSDDVRHEGFVVTSPDNDRKLTSIAQDILYLASKGRVATPKHMALGMAIRHWTGSSNLITLLNGFGHSISHSAVLEYDTALANMELTRNNIVPDGFKPEVHTTLIWDNNDFMEETRSGAGTTHNTNGIIVQRFSELETNAQNQLTKMKKTGKRSVEPPARNILAYYSQKKRGPARIMCEKELIPNDQNPIQTPYFLLDNAFCFISKLTQADSITLPGWTGFNTKLVSKIPKLSKIGYLPVIDASPTEMSTVYTILVRSIEIAQTWIGQYSNLCKGSQIRWQDEVFSKRLVIR